MFPVSARFVLTLLRLAQRRTLSRRWTPPSEGAVASSDAGWTILGIRGGRRTPVIWRAAPGMAGQLHRASSCSLLLFPPFRPPFPPALDHVCGNIPIPLLPRRTSRMSPRSLVPAALDARARMLRLPSLPQWQDAPGMMLGNQRLYRYSRLSGTGGSDCAERA